MDRFLYIFYIFNDVLRTSFLYYRTRKKKPLKKVKKGDLVGVIMPKRFSAFLTNRCRNHNGI